LIDQPPCPVIVVYPDQESPAVRSIVVGTDFSSSAERATDLSLNFARTLRADLKVVHVVESEPEGNSGDQGSEEPEGNGEDPERLRRLRRQLSERADGLEGASVETQLLCQRPAEGLAEFVRDSGADMLVVGRSGHSPFIATVLGSVLSKVISKVPATIVVAPAGE